MVALDCSHLETLVSEERVHRDVYLDADIFELEMERIFGQAGGYVGHDSMVPNPGDYICTYIGSQPIVLSRHASGKTHVLLNRCGHRGAKVLSEDSGHSDRFRCCYHGWLIHRDGTILETPGEPAESRLKHSLVHGGYPVIEKQGLVFAYMGPSAEMPQFPLFSRR